MLRHEQAGRKIIHSNADKRIGVMIFNIFRSFFRENLCFGVTIRVPLLPVRPF